MKRGRKKLPDALKAKNWTIKVYDWEREPVKKFLKERRSHMKEDDENDIKVEDLETPKELEEKYARIYDYEPTDEDIRRAYGEDFLRKLNAL